MIEHFKETNLVGIITTLDSILLFRGGNCSVVVDSNIPTNWISITHTVFHMLNGLCQLNLIAIQV